MKTVVSSSLGLRLCAVACAIAIGCSTSEPPPKQQQPTAQPVVVVPPAPPEPPSPAQTVSFIPDSVTLLFGAQLKALAATQSDTARAVLDQLAPVTTLLGQAGASRDAIQYLWAASNADGSEQLVCVVSTAPFPPDLVEKLGGKTQQTVGGRQISLLESGEAAICLPDSTTLLFGKRTTVQAALSSPAEGSVRKGLLAMDNIPDVYVAGDLARAEHQFQNEGLPLVGKVPLQLRNVDGFAIGLKLGTEIAGESSGTASVPGAPGAPNAEPVPKGAEATASPRLPGANSSGSRVTAGPPPRGTPFEVYAGLSFSQPGVADGIRRSLDQFMNASRSRLAPRTVQLRRAVVNDEPAETDSPDAVAPDDPAGAPGPNPQRRGPGYGGLKPGAGRPNSGPPPADKGADAPRTRTRQSRTRAEIITFTTPNYALEGTVTGGAQGTSSGTGGGGPGWTRSDANVLCIGYRYVAPPGPEGRVSFGNDFLRALALTPIGTDFFRGSLGELHAALEKLRTDKPDDWKGLTPVMPGETVRNPSWMVHLLPFVGEEQVYFALDLSKTWSDPQNVPAARRVVTAFLNPGDERTQWQGYPYDGLGLTHFAGMSGVEDGRNVVAAALPRDDPRAGIFGYDAIARPEEITDGQSSTVMIVGSGKLAGPWVAGGGSTIRGARAPYFDGLSGFGSAGLAQPGTYVLFADGSARVISASIDPAVFRALCTMHGKEQVDLEAIPKSNGKMAAAAK